LSFLMYSLMNNCTAAENSATLANNNLEWLKAESVRIYSKKVSKVTKVSVSVTVSRVTRISRACLM